MIAKIALLFSVFFPTLAWAQSAEPLSQAKKEGEVILYTTMTVRDFEFFNKAAKEKYPFLNVRHVYLASGRQVTRVMQEHRAGRVQADVLGNSPDPLLYFKRQGVTGPQPLAREQEFAGGSLGSRWLLVRHDHRPAAHRLQSENDFKGGGAEELR